MKIVITNAPPLEKRHGITTGRRFETLRREHGGRGCNGYWVMGDDKEEVLIFDRELEELG